MAGAMRAHALLLSVLLSAAACGGSEPPPGSSSELEEGERPDEPGATRASREAALATGGEDRVAPSEPAPAALERPLVRAYPVEIAEGEDGRGNVVAAAQPIAVDLDARRFPPRALDPVLHVGELRFTRYSHPRPGVLRFVVADRALLPQGAEVAVQYGDDASSRVVVSGALEVEP